MAKLYSYKLSEDPNIVEYIEILMNNQGNISESVYDRIEYSMRNLLTY